MLRIQPFRAITIHIDYKLPTVRIKEGRCLPSAPRGECKLFHHLIIYTMLGNIRGKKERRKESEECVEKLTTDHLAFPDETPVGSQGATE